MRIRDLLKSKSELSTHLVRRIRDIKSGQQFLRTTERFYVQPEVEMSEEEPLIDSASFAAELMRDLYEQYGERKMEDETLDDYFDIQNALAAPERRFWSIEKREELPAFYAWAAAANRLVTYLGTNSPLVGPLLTNSEKAKLSAPEPTRWYKTYSWRK